MPRNVKNDIPHSGREKKLEVSVALDNLSNLNQELPRVATLENLPVRINEKHDCSSTG